MNNKLYLCFLTLLIITSFLEALTAQEVGKPWKKTIDFQQSELGEVYAITADHRNLLWIASSTGLYNFDGYKFEKIIPFEVRSLLIESSNETLWIGSNSGIYTFDLQSQEIAKVGLEKKLISSAEFYFKDFYEDINHKIWATSFNGLYLCQPDTCVNLLIEEEALKVQEDPYYNRLNAIEPHDQPDSFYIASLKGVYTFNINTHQFNNTNLSDEIVSDIVNTGDKLYLAKYKDIVEVHSKSMSHVDSIVMPEGIVINKLQFDNNKIWICTETGLFTHKDSLTFFDIAAEPLYSNRRPNCKTVFKDKFGHYWAGFENGLYLWDPLRNIISAEAASNILRQANAQIYEVNETQEGTLLINSNINKVTEYDPANKNISTQFQQFRDVLIIHDSLWAFTINEQLVGYNPKLQKFDLILDQDAFKQADFQSYLSHLFDKKNNALIVGRQWGRGITDIGLENENIQKYDQANFFTIENLTSTGFNYLVTDLDNNLYFTSGKGLGKLNLSSGKATLITNPKKTASTGIAKDKNGKIYVVFATDGLYKLSSTLEKIELGINHIETILFDKEQLWATSTSGLLNINLDNKTFYTLGKANGLPKNNLYGVKMKAGHTDNIFLYRDDWLANLDNSKLNDLEQFNTVPIITTSGNHTFNFSSRNYKPPGMNRFEYQLKGNSEDWNQVTKLNEVSFNNLASGSYIFQVRSSFAQQAWKYSDTFPINIPHPWWLRWYTLVLAVAGFSTMIYFYNRQVRKQEKLKSQLKSVEMQTLRSQMNPHFIFNALNSVKHFILGNDKFEAAEYLSNFSMLIRKILVNSESEVIPLFEEIETLKLYLQMEQKRFDHKFEYEININSNVDTELTKIPPLILQPYVENAIWHGLLHKESGGQLKIKIKSEEGFTIYEIIDNGIGRVKAAEIKTKSALKKKSLGMQITRDRLIASKINAEVKIVDLPQGTKVILKIPEL